jgi:type I restriction enzyme R subunit
MIEFKQIIGRGTRLYEGKHYFTIIDFVNAYHLFNDPEWDGEPIEPEPVKPSVPSDPKQPAGGSEGDGEPDNDQPKEKKVKIRLSDGKVREIQSMRSTLFYVDCKPISAEEFLRRLFDHVKLPSLLGSEEELRRLWSNPLTRRELMQKLEKEGCHRDDLIKLQELIEAENSDLFDVLEYIAYAKPPISRAARVESNQSNIYTLLDAPQREFVTYVLSNYVQQGVDELDIGKLSTILQAKYGSVHAAQQQLGDAEDIRQTFIDFQRHLYDEKAA